METARIIYVSELQTESTHLASGSKILTDAPVDNNGKGSTFSPTDLLCSSLVSCMLTIMGIKAQKAGFTLGSISCAMTKIMGTEPRRVTRIEIVMTLKGVYNEEQRKLLEEAALNCPVAKSLHPEIKQEIEFRYE